MNRKKQDQESDEKKKKSQHWTWRQMAEGTEYSRQQNGKHNQYKID